MLNSSRDWRNEVPRDDAHRLTGVSDSSVCNGALKLLKYGLVLGCFLSLLVHLQLESSATVATAFIQPDVSILSWTLQKCKMMDDAPFFLTVKNIINLRINVGIFQPRSYVVFNWIRWCSRKQHCSHSFQWGLCVTFWLQWCRSLQRDRVDPESIFGEMQPYVTATDGCGGQSQMTNRLIGDWGSTRRRGGHFSSFGNIQSKVRLCCWLSCWPTHFKNMREIERLWLSELYSEWREGVKKPVNYINKMLFSDCCYVLEHKLTHIPTHLHSTLIHLLHCRDSVNTIKYTDCHLTKLAACSSAHQFMYMSGMLLILCTYVLEKY